ncbi:MAG: electron transport complex subunit RsxC [Halothiobacillaceae bacterium]
MIALHDFHGGLHQPGKKDLSNREPIRRLEATGTLILPLHMHIGQPARPLVEPGDRVGLGQMIAVPDGRVSAAVHAPVSGTIRAIESRPIPHPSGLPAPCILLEPDGAGRQASEPLEPWPDYRAHDPAQIRERLKLAGVVGLGGAAFPTSVKLDLPPNRKIDTLILNGAECEAYITCDDRLMRERAEQIILGGQVIMHAVGAERCLVGLEDNKPEAAQALEDAIERVGDSRFSVVVVPTRYPAGGEKQLILTLTGVEVPRSRHATDYGMLCQNVATALACHEAVVFGLPVTRRVITVTGEGIARPGNFDVPLGTPASVLIEAAGGYLPGVDRLLVGGPMMGFTLPSDDIPVVKATNCLLALRPQDRPAEQPAMPCIRCGKCAEYCPADLLPQQLYWHARARDYERAREYHLFDCIECGVCSAVCPSHIPLVQYFRHAKTEIWTREQERAKSELARERYEFHQERIEREKAERANAMARKKAALAARKQSGADDEAGGEPGTGSSGNGKGVDKDEIAAAVARAKARKAAKQAEAEKADGDRE